MSRRPSPNPGLVALTLGLVVALGLTAGCQALGSDDSATDEAEQLARALSVREVSGVTFYDQSPEEVADSFGAVLAGMGDLEPDVAVAATHEASGRVTTDLDWSWHVAGRVWSYRSEATFIKTSDGWAARWEPSLVHPDLAQGERLDVTPILARRGAVLGRDDAEIVVPRDVTTFGINRSTVRAGDAEASARALAALTGVDAEAYVARVLASGPEAFVPAITLRRGSAPQTLVDGMKTIKGAGFVDDDLPLAPTKEFAAPLLGSVGDVTAELLEEHPDRYRAGDQVGLSGLQARYDDQLRGEPGAVVNRVSSSGQEQELFRVGAHPGSPLRLNLDVDLQQRAEQLLSSVRSASALVAVRPSTGALLVAANGPANDGYNYATYGQVAPGSTFKTVSALALLRSGLEPAAELPCPPTLDVDGKSFKNYSDYPSSALGAITFETAFANSCNTSFVSQADALSHQDLAGAAADLGVGVDHELGFPAFLGSVAAPASRTEQAADLIGQGRVLTSPLAMAAVAASVQAGRTVVPRLLSGPGPRGDRGSGPRPERGGCTAGPDAERRHRRQRDRPLRPPGSARPGQDGHGGVREGG